jgi:kumamolisin
MRHTRPVTVALALLTLVVAGSASAARREVGQPAPPHTSSVRLAGHVPPALAHVTAVDPTPGDEAAPLTLTVVLRRRDQRGFERFLHDVYDPASNVYRHFLTQRELTDRFGPSRRAYEAVRGFFRSSGFEIVQTSANRLTLTVRAPRATVERTLALRMGRYRLGDREVHATDRNPAVPAALAPSIQAITGLSDLAEPHGTIVAALIYAFCLVELPQFSEPGQPAPPPAQGQQAFQECLSFFKWLLGGGGGPPPASFLAQARTAADPPWLGVDGTGQKIGLVEFDGFNPQDVLDYASLAGLPAMAVDHLSQVHVNGGASPGPEQSEVLLDIAATLTLAPGASTVVYDAPFGGAGSSFQQVFNAMLEDGVTIVSNSWAYCEDQTSAADAQSIDTILASAAASGVTVLNAAGDTGSTCLDGHANTVAVPADSPNATAVGGSSLMVGPGSTYAGETWWDGAAHVPPTGQGGFGTSAFFARPSYQSALNAGAMRSVPDVVVNADPAQGVMLCQASAGGCPTGLLYGGTSAAAPVWAAFTALLNQSQGQNLGALNPRLYPLASTTAFHDPASLGSDFAHVGLGSPNLTALHLALSGGSVGLPSASVSEIRRFAEAPAPSPGVTTGVPADGTTQGFVVVRLRDASGDAIGGKTVTLAANAGTHATISAPSGPSSTADGSVVFTVTDLSAETLTLTATDMTDDIVLQNHPTLIFDVPPATSAGIAAFPLTVTADGVTTTTITVTLKDALNRPTPGKQITLAQGGGHSIVTAPSPSVTDAGGQIQFVAVDSVNETVTYTAVDVTDGALPVPGNAQVTFNNGAGTACGNSTPPTAAAGFAVTAFTTGYAAGPLSYGNINFGGCSGVSPPAFDGPDAFVLNFLNGDVFKLPSTGGAASNTSKLATIGPTLGWPTIGKDGSLFASRDATIGDFTTGAVLQLDPDTGAVMRAVASNLKCPGGLAIDPLSGDLFAAGFCYGAGSDDPNIYRIHDPGGAAPTIETYATLPSTPNGDLAFAPNGSLYVVSGYTNPNAPVVRVSGTNGPATPTVTPLSGVTSTFWINVGDVDPGGEARTLITLASDGLKLTDISASPPTSTLLAQNLGGGRTGPDGCLYSSSSDGTTVYKLSDADGSCHFATTAASPTLALAPVTVTPNALQGTAQTFTASLRNLASPAGTPIFFTVTGTNPTIKMVRADAAGHAALTYTGTHAGDDVVVATASVGDSTLTSNRARVSWDGGKDTTFLTLNPSPTAGRTGEAVGVVAALADSSQTPPIAVPGATIQFTLGASHCAAITNAGGVATCAVTPSTAGLAPLMAAFAGTSQLVASSASVGFNIVSRPCAPLNCDDADPCTADTCADGQCKHAAPAAFDGATCYVDAAKAALQTASAADVKRRTKAQLLTKLTKVRNLVQTARGGGKKGKRALKKAERLLGALEKQLGKFPGKKLAGTLATELARFVGNAKAALETV